MKNPATIRTARRLLRATRAVERARRAVNAPARRRTRRKSLSPLEKIRALPGLADFPEDSLEDFIAPDGSLRAGRGWPADISGPILRALGTPQRQAKGRGSTGDDPSGAEFRQRMLRATKSAADLRRMGIENPPRTRRIAAAGRRMTLEVKGRQLVAVHGPGAKDMGKALALSKRWNARSAEFVQVARVPPGTPPVLVLLGELTDVGYRSDKWGGKRHYYIHKTRNPRPLLCATPDGRRVVILGGGMTVQAAGLVG